ncbi:hypothetical protein YQE_00743, partial [Dendroctonus ponderosae]
MAQSQVRQNFHKDCEDAINKQINLQLFTSYTFVYMAYHLERDNVALPGFSEIFKYASDAELEHAKRLMNQLNIRGGRIVLMAIEAPEKQEWGTVVEIMQDALELEKRAHEARHQDVNLCHFVGTLMQTQVCYIKNFADAVSGLKRIGEGWELVIYDYQMAPLGYGTDTSSTYN